MFRKAIFCAVSTVFLTGTVVAADMKGPVYKAAPVAYNWSGWYGGVDAGWLGSKADQIVPGITTARVDPDGFVGGAHIGYRWQAPASRWVWGIEADLWGSTADGQLLYTGVINHAILNLNWGASFRGVAGMTLAPQTLLYATGGVSFINIDGCTTTGVLGVCAAATQFKDDRVGWTVGVGVAHAFAPRMIARIEYIYADYGSETYTTPGLAGGLTAVDLQTHTIRGGLSWRF